MNHSFSHFRHLDENLDMLLPYFALFWLCRILAQSQVALSLSLAGFRNFAQVSLSNASQPVVYKDLAIAFPRFLFHTVPALAESFPLTRNFQILSPHKVLCPKTAHPAAFALNCQGSAFSNSLGFNRFPPSYISPDHLLSPSTMAPTNRSRGSSCSSQAEFASDDQLRSYYHFPPFNHNDVEGRTFRARRALCARLALLLPLLCAMIAAVVIFSTKSRKNTIVH